MFSETHVKQQLVNISEDGLHECISLNRRAFTQHSVGYWIALLCIQLPSLDIVQGCQLLLELW